MTNKAVLTPDDYGVLTTIIDMLTVSPGMSKDHKLVQGLTEVRSRIVRGQAKPISGVAPQSGFRRYLFNQGDARDFAVHADSIGPDPKVVDVAKAKKLIEEYFAAFPGVYNYHRFVQDHLLATYGSEKTWREAGLHLGVDLAAPDTDRSTVSGVTLEQNSNDKLATVTEQPLYSTWGALYACKDFHTLRAALRLHKRPSAVTKVERAAQKERDFAESYGMAAERLDALRTVVKAPQAEPAVIVHHRKSNNQYEVLDVGRHIDTDVVHVMYRECEIGKQRPIWVRPLTEFGERVFVRGTIGPRFVPCNPRLVCACGPLAMFDDASNKCTLCGGLPPTNVAMPAVASDPKITAEVKLRERIRDLPLTTPADREELFQLLNTITKDES